MPTHVAFLRAINVGGHTVTMETLRKVCASKALGLANVSTFIASGNVLFDTAATDLAALETRIEIALKKSLGYEVATFIRSMPDVAAIATRRVFAGEPTDAPGRAVFVVFLKSPPDKAAVKKLLTFRSPIDALHVHGREVYRLLRGRFDESPFSGPLLEKTLGMPATFRNITTIRRLAAKYPAE